MLLKTGTGQGLPEEGYNPDDIIETLHQIKTDDFDWRSGALPSYTYFLDEETLDLQKAAYCEYIAENGLANTRVLQSIPQLITDIDAFVKQLFHAPSGAASTFTSGGTESVIMAVKTCRDKVRSQRKEPLGHYNIVASSTAHPCLNKAAELMDLEVRRVPVDSENRSDVERILTSIDDRTIMIYASAPCFPYGVFDRITEIAELALRKNLWLHVDACWGGMISPFAAELGYPIPDWDLKLDGVSSLSADLHKFGYAAKGASVVVYRSQADRDHEKFSFSNWPRGTYETPTLAGSKPAGAVAAAWAVMSYLGHDGYLRATKETMDATMLLIHGINRIDGLQCLEPNSESNIFNFVSTSSEIDIMAVAGDLEKSGWFRGRLRDPLGIHQGVTPAHLPTVDQYLEAVVTAVDRVRRSGTKATYDARSY